MVEDPGDAPIKPIDTSVKPEAPLPTERLNHADKLDPLQEKVIAEVVDPTDPTPGTPEDRIVAPRATAPKTGDMAGLWAAVGCLALGGAVLLSRKRKA